MSRTTLMPSDSHAGQSIEKLRSSAVATLAAATTVLVEAGVGGRLVAGALVTAAFAALAYALQGVSRAGAWAGAAVSYAVYVAAGPGAFITLVAVFLLAVVSTRAGYARKQRLGKAEPRRGRSAAQVLANLGAAALLASFSAAASPRFHYALLAACAAALAEAAADTVSSECGVAWSDDVRLVTTWERVAPGTDGGVSTPGTLAGVVAATAVASVAAVTQMVAFTDVPVVAGAGLAGTFFDSVLGATLQRRGLIGNNAVNVAGTVAAAVIALAAEAL